MIYITYTNVYRPLPKDMFQYARLDVHFLCSAAHLIIQSLLTLGGFEYKYLETIVIHTHCEELANTTPTKAANRREGGGVRGVPIEVEVSRGGEVTGNLCSSDVSDGTRPSNCALTTNTLDDSMVSEIACMNMDEVDAGDITNDHTSSRGSASGTPSFMRDSDSLGSYGSDADNKIYDHMWEDWGDDCTDDVEGNGVKEGEW